MSKTEGEIMRELMNDCSFRKSQELREKYDLGLYEVNLDYEQPNQMMFEDTILKEGLTRTYPIDKTIKYLLDCFSNYPLQIKKVQCANGITGLNVTYPDINKNRGKIERILNLCGFFFSRDKTEDEYKIDNINFVTSQYQPKFIDSYKDIREEEKVLYHATLSYNDKSIFEVGFTPYAKNKINTYPPRIFFSKGSVGYEYALQMAMNLYIRNPDRDIKRGEKDKRKNNLYTLFTIGLSKVPEDVKFYKDPGSYNGVWTSDNIPPSAITDVKHYKFDYYIEDKEVRVKYTELD